MGDKIIRFIQRSPVILAITLFLFSTVFCWYIFSEYKNTNIFYLIVIFLLLPSICSNSNQAPFFRTMRLILSAHSTIIILFLWLIISFHPNSRISFELTLYASIWYTSCNKQILARNDLFFSFLVSRFAFRVLRYCFITTNVGLVYGPFAPSPFSTPCEKVVFPLPSSPVRQIISPPWSSSASISPSFWVCLALFVINTSFFFIITIVA